MAAVTVQAGALLPVSRRAAAVAATAVSVDEVQPAALAGLRTIPPWSRWIRAVPAAPVAAAPAAEAEAQSNCTSAEHCKSTERLPPTAQVPRTRAREVAREGAFGSRLELSLETELSSPMAVRANPSMAAVAAVDG